MRLVDAKGQPILALIVGHRRVRTRGALPDQVYVRRPGTKQSWLAEGDLQVDADPQQWLDRDIMNLDHAQVARVVSTRGDSVVELDRAGGKLVLKTPEQHPKLDAYKLEDVSRALELLTFEDVHKSDDKAGDLVGHSVFSTSDGMTVTLTVFKPKAAQSAKPEGDKHILVQFAVTGQDKSKAQAEHLEHRVAGWTYELGAWKEQAFLPDIDTLKAPAPAASSASGAAASAKQ